MQSRRPSNRHSSLYLSGATRFVLAMAMIVVAPSAFAQTLSFSSGGGPLTLTINSAVAGGQPTDVSDNSSEITWDGNLGVPGKITVGTSCPSQSFRLYVLLTVTSWGSGTTGTSQPEIELSDGMLDTDIFRDIPTTAPARQGTGTIRYRAAATVSQGNSAENGDDIHIVTYTLSVQ